MSRGTHRSIDVLEDPHDDRTSGCCHRRRNRFKQCVGEPPLMRGGSVGFRATVIAALAAAIVGGRGRRGVGVGHGLAEATNGGSVHVAVVVVVVMGIVGLTRLDCCGHSGARGAIGAVGCNVGSDSDIVAAGHRTEDSSRHM